MVTRQQTFGMLAVIALAFAVSSMTALRLPGLPIGLSELILVVCMAIHIPLGFGIHGANQPNRFVPFLFLLMVATLPGYALTLASQAVDQAGASYNLIAMVYVVLLFAYLHFGFDHGKFDLDKLVQLFVVLSTLYFLIILLLSQVEPSLVYAQDDIDELLALVNEDGEIELRLVGFAANPNQLALHALVVLFFVLQLRSKSSFMATAICFLAAAAIGLMAESDAFLFAMIALVGVAVVMGIVFKGSGMTKILVLLPAVVLGLLVIDPLAGAIQEIANTRDQNLVRFALWENGILAGMERPVVGLGPGAWSGPEAPMEFEEAHNSVIDYFSNAGLIGLALLLLGMGAVFFRTLISKDPVLFAGVVAFFIFAMFHMVLRQPILWLVFYYIAQRVGQQGRVPVRQRQRQRRRVYRNASSPPPKATT